MARQKHHHLGVHRIQGHDGQWISDPVDLGNSAVSFFHALLSGDEASSEVSDFGCIPSLILDEDNVSLCALPTLEEVCCAVFSIDPDSSPGPDGFCSRFYQVFWEVVGKDLHLAVLDFFQGSPMPRGFISTLIVLLPKKASPCSWADFRPISLCNVSNKVITKVLGSRLSGILPKLISPSQSGFVSGKIIHDNFLLAQELVHDLNRRTRGGNVVLKLDMAKAYDRLSWPFLLHMLRAFGFSEHWISLINHAISNSWFSVLVNGVPKGFFRSHHGLRQGDPISPSLFIIAAEFLSRSLDRLVTRFPSLAYATGVPMAISHLSFADDMIIFANGSRSSLARIMCALHRYEALSGQLVSQDKSRFYIGRHSSGSRRDIVRSATRFQ